MIASVTVTTIKENVIYFIRLIIILKWSNEWLHWKVTDYRFVTSHHVTLQWTYLVILTWSLFGDSIVKSSQRLHFNEWPHKVNADIRNEVTCWCSGDRHFGDNTVKLPCHECCFVKGHQTTILMLLGNSSESIYDSDFTM